MWRGAVSFRVAATIGQRLDATAEMPILRAGERFARASAYRR
jgi:hypothetical protein